MTATKMGARRLNARKAMLESFLALNKTEGDILTHEEIEAMSGLPDQDFSGLAVPDIVKAVKKRQLQIAQYVEELRDVLLTCEYGIEIKSVISQGYRLTPREKRVDSAVDDHRSELKKALARFEKRAYHIPAVSQLPYEQQRKLDHEKSVASMVRAMMKTSHSGVR